MTSRRLLTASSSSYAASSIPPKSNDVFLSFRGKDTRFNFTDHLYKYLINRGIRTFRDDVKLRRGETIAPELWNAIEDSRSSVIVFSENYADSKWCLDELVKIMECWNYVARPHAVFPIFYHVDPADVRNQSGPFEKGFADYEENCKEKVGRWRSALTQAGSLSGYHIQHGYESDHIKKITTDIISLLNCKRIDVGANYLVGLHSRIEEVNLLLRMESNDVRIVGIYGLGGIGKTTIAKVICHELYCKFEAMSFLENIRVASNPHGLHHLKNQLLHDIAGGQGATMIKKRVLIVLDDVDHLDQLKCLLGNGEWLGEGSRVIITTRNRHMLTVGVDDLYEVPGLNLEEATELFCWYAFRQNVPKSEFAHLLDQIVQHCQGLPLALKLYAKIISEWKIELYKLETIPEITIPEKDILDILKISFDRLSDTEKDILLDVACFFESKEDKDFVSRIFDGCNFHGEIGLKNLNDSHFITTVDNEIHMHDLIRKMGQEIVRGDLPNEPDKWSRLWYHRDINLALTRYKGMDRFETISLDLSKLKRILHFHPNALANMTRLRLLKVHSGLFFNPQADEEEVCDYIRENASKLKLDENFQFPSGLRYLRWDGYPLKYLPSSFEGGHIIELDLRCSNIKQLSQGNELNLQSLKVLDISQSCKLIQMSSFFNMSNLEKLKARGCVSLIEIYPSIGVLKKLTTLDLSNCNKFKSLPSSIVNLESLEILDLSGCSRFEKFPEIQGNMRSLQRLNLSQSAIRELPSGIGLESVEILDLSNCFKFEKFPKNGANMKSLKELYLDNTAVKEFPIGIANWGSLPTLDLSKCLEFEKFPDTIRDMISLEIIDLSYCSKFEKFPEKIENMKSLRKLYLRNTAIKYLPDSIEEFVSLKILDVSNCLKFEKFPEVKRGMNRLEELNLRRTAVKELPSSIVNLYGLLSLNLGECKNLRSLPENFYQLESLQCLVLYGCSYLWKGLILKLLRNSSRLSVIQADGFRSTEDLLNIFRRFLNCRLTYGKKKHFNAVFPESSEVAEWIGCDKLGSEVTTELPVNWYENRDFRGFIVSCVYQPINYVLVTCELNIHGNGFEFKDEFQYSWLLGPRNDLNDQVWVWWYPKMDIPKEHRHKFTHVTASFGKCIQRDDGKIEKCGINLVCVGDFLENYGLMDQ